MSKDAQIWRGSRAHTFEEPDEEEQPFGHAGTDGRSPCFHVKRDQDAWHQDKSGDPRGDEPSEITAQAVEGTANQGIVNDNESQVEETGHQADPERQQQHRTRPRAERLSRILDVVTIGSDTPSRSRFFG